MIELLQGLNCVTQALLATLFTWGVTAAGAACVFFFRAGHGNALDAMLGFAGGIMIAASFWSLLAPAIEIAENLSIQGMLPMGNLSIPVQLAPLCGFLAGGALLFIGDRILTNALEKNYNKSRYCREAENDINNEFNLSQQGTVIISDGLSEAEAASCARLGMKRCLLLITSITLHNIPEGLVVGVAFGAAAYGLTGSTLQSACILALGIGLQNFPEGTAVSVPLRREGLPRRKAFLMGQASGIVEPIAGVIGAALAISVRALLPWLLSFAAGAMIYVVVEELIPESQSNDRKDIMALFTLIGFSIMMFLDISL